MITESVDWRIGASVFGRFNKTPAEQNNISQKSLVDY